MKHIKSLAAVAIMFSSGVNANNIPESPSIDSFDTVAPSFVQEKKEVNDYEMTSLKTNKVLPVLDIIQERKSGVYISPTDENEVIVLAFKSNNFEDNYKIDKEIKNFLTENDYLEYSDQKRDYKRQTFEKNIENHGSYHSPGRALVDKYSYIVLDPEQIDKIMDEAKKSKNNYSDEMIELLPVAVLYHELAHSHKHQKKTTKDFIHEHSSLKTEDLNNLKLKKEFDLQNLGGENYSDSFMLVNMAIMMKGKYGSHKSSKIHDQLYTFFDEEFRQDGSRKDYNTHATRAVLKTTKDFIDNNWEVIEGFKKDKNSKSLEQISASITNGTLNHPVIAPVNNSKYSQKEIERNGGLSSRILREASKDVNKGIQEMVTLEGDKVSFSYKPNIHKEYKDTLRHNRN